MATTYLNKADLLRRSMRVADILSCEEEDQFWAEHERARLAHADAEFDREIKYQLHLLMARSQKAWTPHRIATETCRLERILSEQNAKQAVRAERLRIASSKKWWSQECAYRHTVNTAIARDRKKVKIAAVLAEIERVTNMDMDSDADSDSDPDSESESPASAVTYALYAYNAYSDPSDYEDSVRAPKAPKVPKEPRAPKAPKHVVKPRKPCLY